LQQRWLPNRKRATGLYDPERRDLQLESLREGSFEPILRREVSTERVREAEREQIIAWALDHVFRDYSTKGSG
jgi:hypothetical protein